MKQVLVICAMLLVSVVILGASLFPKSSNPGTDGNGNFIQDGVPSSFVVYSTTKKSIKQSMRSINGIAVRPGAACSAYLNGKGGDWLMDSGSVQRFRTFRNISTMTFTCASTASTAKTKIRVQVF